MAGTLGGVDFLCRLFADDHPLAVHLVLGEVLDVHGAEVPYAHVYGDESLVYILENHPVEQFTAEVETGCRSGHCTFVPCEYGLELLRVPLVRVFLDPLGNRGLAEGKEGCLELVIRSVIEETQGPAPGGGVVYDLRYHALIFAEVELVANPDLPCWIDDDIPELLLPVEFAEQEHHYVGTCLLLLSQELGRKHFGIVEHDAVALAEVVYEVLELAVLDFAAVLVEDHQFALVPPLNPAVDFRHKFSGNFVFRQIEVEL